jgi:hypothetical protein
MRELPAGLALFVQARFYVIFSLLFGIGFAIFLERASARSGLAAGLVAVAGDRRRAGDQGAGGGPAGAAVVPT